MKSSELKSSFIERSRSKFGTKFTFNKANYVNYHTKIIITCPIHGDITITPDAHIKSKYGCKECAKVSAPVIKEGTSSPVKTTEQFIIDSIQVHGNKYDYSSTIYKNRLSPVSIICPLHGEFTLPQACRHLEGRGCKECYITNMFLTKEEYLTQAREKHGDKYSYECTNYIGKKFDIIVTCPIHGYFTINAERHTKGFGCKLCKRSKKTICK